MNIAIPAVVSQLKTPYSPMEATCASSNQCEADVNRNTTLSYPKNIKKEFAIDFTPVDYGVPSGTATRPNRDTLEKFVNPSGMGPIDHITDDMLKEAEKLAAFRISSDPSVVSDDPTQRLLDPAATISNSKAAFESFQQGSSGQHHARINIALAATLAAGLAGLVFLFNSQK